MRLLFTLLLSLAAYGQVVRNADSINIGTVNFLADAGGDDTYAGTIPRVTSYIDGQEFLLRVATQNTGACTVDFGGGAKPIKKSTTGGLADPSDGDVRDFVRLAYSQAADAFVMVGGSAASVGGSGSAPFAQSFTSQTSVTATHNLNTVNTVTSCYNGSSVRVEPQAITVTSANVVTITFLAAQSGYCVINGGVGPAGPTGPQGPAGPTGATGATGAGASAVSAPWPFLGGGGATDQQVTGSANTAICHRFGTPVSYTWNSLTLRVTTASGTACTGGTCGLRFAIYNDARNSIVALSSVLTSGGSPDYNTTGNKVLTWASGTAVSSGTLTLPAGTYFGCLSTDSTAAFLRFMTQGWLEVDDPTNRHGYQTGFSTGNGGSLTMPSSWTGTLTFSGSGSVVPALVFNP